MKMHSFSILYYIDTQILFIKIIHMKEESLSFYQQR